MSRMFYMFYIPLSPTMLKLEDAARFGSQLAAPKIPRPSASALTSAMSLSRAAFAFGLPSLALLHGSVSWEVETETLACDKTSSQYDSQSCLGDRCETAY